MSENLKVLTSESLPIVPNNQRGSFNDLLMVRLAREIAMEIRPLEEILVSLKVSPDDWAAIGEHPAFQARLATAVSEWSSAINTAERVKLKSLAFVEEALPEFFARAHDPREGLAAKIEVLKAVAKFAGIGGTADFAGAGERVTVTINLGEDRHIRVEKDVTPQGNILGDV